MNLELLLDLALGIVLLVLVPILYRDRQKQRLEQRETMMKIKKAVEA